MRDQNQEAARLTHTCPSTRTGPPKMRAWTSGRVESVLLEPGIPQAVATGLVA